MLSTKRTIVMRGLVFLPILLDGRRISMRACAIAEATLLAIYPVSLRHQVSGRGAQ